MTNPEIRAEIVENHKTDDYNEHHFQVDFYNDNRKHRHMSCLQYLTKQEAELISRLINEPARVEGIIGEMKKASLKNKDDMKKAINKEYFVGYGDALDELQRRLKGE